MVHIHKVARRKYTELISRQQVTLHTHTTAMKIYPFQANTNEVPLTIGTQPCSIRWRRPVSADIEQWVKALFLLFFGFSAFFVLVGSQFHGVTKTVRNGTICPNVPSTFHFVEITIRAWGIERLHTTNRQTL